MAKTNFGRPQASVLMARSDPAVSDCSILYSMPRAYCDSEIKYQPDMWAVDKIAELLTAYLDVKRNMMLRHHRYIAASACFF